MLLFWAFSWIILDRQCKSSRLSILFPEILRTFRHGCIRNLHNIHLSPAQTNVRVEKREFAWEFSQLSNENKSCMRVDESWLDTTSQMSNFTIRDVMRWYGHVIKRDEGELVRDIMEWRNQKMWGGRHCREGEGNKVEMVWTCDKKRWRRASHRYYAMKRSEEDV